VFYDATDMARSNSLQASRSGSMSLPAFGTDSSLDGERYYIWVLFCKVVNEFWERAVYTGSILLSALGGKGTRGCSSFTAARLSIKMSRPFHPGSTMLDAAGRDPFKEAESKS